MNEKINELKIKIEEKQTELNLNILQKETNNNLTKNNNSKTKCILYHEENENNDTLKHKIKNYYKISNGKEKEKDEHNNTVKYYRNNNMNIYHGQFNKLQPKILSYKSKKIREESNTNNDKKSTKVNTNNNNDFLSTTRNEYTERLNHKCLSGNNKAKQKKNDNNLNKKNMVFR